MPGIPRVFDWIWTNGPLEKSNGGPGRNPSTKFRVGDNVEIRFSPFSGISANPAAMSLVFTLADSATGATIGTALDTDPSSSPAYFVKTSTGWSVFLTTAFTQGLSEHTYFASVTDLTAGTGGCVAYGYPDLGGNPEYAGPVLPPSGILTVAAGGSGMNGSASVGVWIQESAGATVTAVPLGSGLSIVDGSLVATGGGGGGAVSAVFGRTGNVVAQSSDYTAAQVGADPSGSAAAAQAASQPLDSDLTAIAALSTTAFGRNLLTLANAAAGQTAFGLGTASTHATTDFALSTTSVAGHALSGNVTIQASDMTNGTTGTGAVVLQHSPTMTGTATADGFICGAADVGSLTVDNGINSDGGLFVSDGSGGVTVAALNGLTFTAGSGTLTLSTFMLTAVQSGNVATTAYVDNVAQGMQPKPAADAVTTGTLPACTYANGSSGVGATLTGNSNGALAAQDGVTLTVGQVLLVNNQAAPAQNGLYTLTQVGDGSHPFILARHVDMDSATEFDGFLPVHGGTLNANSLWLSSIGSTTSFTVGTTSVTFTRMNKATDLQQGNGIGISGNTVAIDTSVTVDKTTAQTMTNKTMTAPVINSPTGIVKGDVGLGNVENTALSTWAGGTSIVTVGTIGTGTWHGTTIDVGHGGTGLTTATSYAPVFGGTSGAGAFQSGTAGTAGQVLKSGGAAAIGAYADDIGTITLSIDGGGSAITTGVKGYVNCPYAGTIASATLVSDQTGSIVIDVWKLAFSTSALPTVANTITASALPTLSSAKGAQDTTLSGWTTSVLAGDTFGFNVNSAATLTRATLTLKIKKS